MREILAYMTMVRFLEDRYRKLPSEALGGLLGELTLLMDGMPADPAIRADWEQALKGIGGEGAPEVVPMRRAG